MPSLDFGVTFDGSGNASFDPQHGYLGTLAEIAPGSPTLQPTYHHGDLIGSVQLATDGSGAAGSSPATLAYAAFGEHVTAGSGSAAKVGWPVTTGSIGATRYHYAGAHGYESGLLSLSGPNATPAPITLQHVGARWYQPGIGRFVQRDPIGTAGGLNTYSYVLSNPLNHIDPSGTSSLVRPDVLVAMIEAQIAQGGGRAIAVQLGGTTLLVKGAEIVQQGGESFIRFNVVGQAAYWWAYKGAGPLLDVTRCASGLYVQPHGGACGATGLEVVPLAALYLWRTRRRRIRVTA